MRTGASRRGYGCFLVVMVTCDKASEARRIARALVSSRTAACASVYPRGESLYWWRGRIESAREHLLLAKTRRRLLPRLVRTVRALHSYEVPEIVALPLAGGSRPYRAWLERELKGKGKGKGKEQR